MDQDKLRAIIDEHGGQDVIIKADEEVKEYFRLLECIECASPVIPIVNPRRPFLPGRLTPNFLAKCTACGSEFDPDSRVISSPGSPTR